MIIRRFGHSLSSVWLAVCMVGLPIGELDHGHFLGYETHAPQSIQSHDCCPNGEEGEVELGRTCATCLRTIHFNALSSSVLPELNAIYCHHLPLRSPAHPSFDFFSLYSKRGPPSV